MPSRPRLAGVILGAVLDGAWGEPPRLIHPVAAFGKAMAAVEVPLWRDRRWAGAVHAAIGVGIAGMTARVLDRASTVGSRRTKRPSFATVRAGTILGEVLTTALAAYVVTARRDLAEEASGIASALRAGDADRARAALPALVGRDADGLDEKEIARAVVESVAESTVDGIVAPLVYAVLGGVPGALVYRAINTMDSMVGHRSDRYANYGWASARLDDVVNWLPARLSVALVALARPGSAVEVVKVVRRDAPRHPSPNAGRPEAAFAAALGVRLGGSNSYDGLAEERATLGHGRPPEVDDIDRAVVLSRQVTRVFVLAVAALAVRPTKRCR
ncbi:MAG: adenosylcobinamide-phosphate synthase CbiB [Acidimicrobiales bacterium]